MSHRVWKRERLAAAAGMGKEDSWHHSQDERPDSWLLAAACPGKEWGPGRGMAGRGGSHSPASFLPPPGVVQPGFLQELLKDCSFGWINFGGNRQMHLALVRDRPKGEAKNIRGRAATQRERA